MLWWLLKILGRVLYVTYWLFVALIFGAIVDIESLRDLFSREACVWASRVIRYGVKHG